jgi:AraC-like DNA-binding protein
MRMRQTIRAFAFDRHIHEQPYAAIVLSGCYEEAGDLGRLRVHEGNVVLHDAFEMHLDRFPASGAELLNVPLPPQCLFQPGLGAIDDPDSFVRLAEKSEAEAAALLVSTVKTRTPESLDWPDELAAALLEDQSLSLSHWARVKGINTWSLSRGFTQVFDVAPSAFRARARARHAWKVIRKSRAPLARIAAHCGFADQSHMTRSIKSMTGATPRAWRCAANGFKTG